jgi:hypothetical protein
MSNIHVPFFVCQASNTAGGEEAVLPYRYEINPLESLKTNCYKPNVLNANCDPEGHKSWALGAVMVGNFDRLPRQDNKTASLVWEAHGQKNGNQDMSLKA